MNDALEALKKSFWSIPIDTMRESVRKAAEKGEKIYPSIYEEEKVERRYTEIN